MRVLPPETSPALPPPHVRRLRELLLQPEEARRQTVAGACRKKPRLDVLRNVTRSEPEHTVARRKNVRTRWKSSRYKGTEGP